MGRFILVVVGIIALIYTSNVGHTKAEEKKTELTYFELEDQIINPGRKYLKQTYDIKNDIVMSVNMNTLVENNYMVPIKDIISGEECKGYVVYTRKEGLETYRPYLKCKNHTTNGYVDFLE